MVARMLLLVVLAASCKDAPTTVPQTRDAASKALDAALVQLNWAQQDLYRLGGRDIVVSVQLDSTLAPHYFRLPRKGAP